MNRYWLAAVGILAGIALTVLVATTLISEPATYRPASGTEAARVSLGGLVSLPVDGSVTVTDSRGETKTAHRALPGPEPAFDPTGLGEEMAFTAGEPRWPVTHRLDTTAGLMYIGDVSEHSVFTYAIGTGVVRRILEWARGDSGNVGAPAVAVGGDRVAGGGTLRPAGAEATGMLSIGILQSTGGGGSSNYVAWVGIPEATAVVALELDDGAALWQRPFGESAFFDVGDYRGDFVFTALSSAGEVLVRHEAENRLGSARLVAPTT